MNAFIGMERFFAWLLQTSWQAAVIAAIILLAQWLLRNRLSPAWRHGLWFLLVARLLMPLAPTSAISIFNLARWHRLRVSPAAPEPATVASTVDFSVTPTIPVQSVPQDLNTHTHPAVTPNAPTQGNSEPALTAAPPPWPLQIAALAGMQAIDWTKIGILVWLAGVFFLALRFLRLNHRFRRRLAGYMPPPDNPVSRLCADCAQSLRVRSRVRVIETDQVESPAIYGIWHKRLLLPGSLKELLSTEELRHVILHELAHVKRRDPEINALASFLQILHWFNPVLWFAFARMRAEREMATDDLALAHTRHKDRGAYGETVLKVLENLRQRRVLPGLVGIGESKAQIKERIRAIARGGGGTRWRWTAAVVAAIIGGVALTNARDEQKPAAMTARDQAPEPASSQQSRRENSAADTNAPRVISVSPQNGAKDVGLIQDLRIRFDKPMDPYHMKLKWEKGGFQLNGNIQISPDRKEFIIPVRLMPGQTQKVVLNHKSSFWNKKEDFRDASEVPANEFRWSFKTKAAPRSPGAAQPQVVSVSPPSGATTPMLTLVEITFNQPMRSPGEGFPYLQKGLFMQTPSLIPDFEYDAASHRFTFPAVLRPDDDTRLTLRGFYGADGVPCDPIILHYRSGTESLDPKYVKRAKAAAQDPDLQRLLAAMKKARAALKSGIETVQTINLGMSKTAFDSIEAQTATFKWQGTNQVYADITGPMGMGRAFILGSDGRSCWVYSVSDKGEKRLDQTPAAVTREQFYLVDPFDLTERSVRDALDRQEIVYAGKASLEGKLCYRVEKWNARQNPVPYAIKQQYWIDAKTLLPRQIVQYSSNGCNLYRFNYQDLNQPLPDRAFQPPAEAEPGAQPSLFKKAPGPDEHRFLRISDASNGWMSGRIGWRGPNGTTDSGLN